MGWRIAKSLEVLLRQLNQLFPNRSKISDGGIGDPRHSARTSDHNPNEKRVVCARDFTHDPANGLDCNKLALQLAKSKDPRIKYIIWNRQISNPSIQNGKWRFYGGSNPHTKHLHLSVKGNYDNESEWSLSGSETAIFHNPELVEFGDRGFAVKKVQELLVKSGFLKDKDVDGIFGRGTEKAVKDFQKANGLGADGIVGKNTWKALES